MKRSIIIVFSLGFVLIFSDSFAQRILFQSDFENLNFTNTDSLPQGWAKLDADSNFFGRGKSWAVRDTNQILGGDTVVNRPHSHSGRKSLHISWFAGKGGSYESDDWVWTDSLNIQSGDSLGFWALLGNTEGISFYVDSLQIWICSLQDPASATNHITTIKSNLDTTINVWTEHKFDLSQFSGQKIYIGFRYYIPVIEALWCNIDDMIIGNRTPVGINQIGINIPSEYYLSQNYPNPFNPITHLEFGISKLEFVSLKIFNVQGKEVVELLNENKLPGNYTVEFNGENLPSGIYFYTLKAGNFSESKKLILTK
ncbi:MAG: choice-of-anchor J domain-containing protein [Ignavibacteria bacterium]